MPTQQEGFLRRWARRKAEVREGVAEPAAPAMPAPAAPARADHAAPDGAGALVAPGDLDAGVPAAASAPAPAPALPTLEDVARLTRDSDFSAFVARGVDPAVRRGALKKLFADPHFNTMDRLDVYIDDYTKPSPVSEAMLASLQHAKGVFRRLVDAPDDAGPAAAPTAAPLPVQALAASADAAPGPAADADAAAAAEPIVVDALVDAADGMRAPPHRAATPAEVGQAR